MSPLIHAITGVALLYAPACGEALAAVEQALELEPTSFTALWCAGMAYQSQGRRDEAIDALEKAAQYSSRSPLVLAFLGHGYGRAGRRDEARAVAAELEGRAVGDFYPGLVYWAMGEHERGFHLMGRGFTQHTALAWLAGTLPGNELLGHDPRWIALLEAAGLGDLAGRMRQQASGPGKL
jgi:tetratricopeptide (TPR) repeat protein